MKKNNIFEKNIFGVCSFFIVLPTIIFFIGYLKVYFSIPFSILILYLWYKILKNEKNEINLINKDTKYYWIITMIVVFVWLLFSGIGSFSFQNTDYDIRNAVFRDLINYKWPIIFENNAGFVYYFSYWLPSSLIGKIFNIKIANIFLLLYSYFLLLCIIYLINLKLKKNSYITLFIFIFFSGFDFLFSIENFNFIQHIEWWSRTFQYSSNTTLLYWVFNQAIPSWLITILIISFKKRESIYFLAPFIFTYSPFATFGMVPIAIYLVLRKLEFKKIFKVFLSLESITTLIILLVYGSFYLSADNTISIRGFSWNLFDNIGSFIISYSIFIIGEILFYILILRKKFRKNNLFKLICLELLIIPFYYMTPSNDFCMRGSIVPIFIIMIYFIIYLTKSTYNKTLIIILILIGMITPLCEINRSIYYTFNISKEEYIEDHDVYSIGNPLSEYGKELCESQFYSINYENKFFFKYLAK